jgi:hypothetical protein
MNARRTVLVTAVLSNLVVVVFAAEPPPRPAAQLLAAIGNIDEMIGGLSDKEYGEVGGGSDTEQGTRPDEGFAGVELLGIKQEAFVSGGVGGFWSKGYDKLESDHDAALDCFTEAGSKRRACEDKLSEYEAKIGTTCERYIAKAI